MTSISCPNVYSSFRSFCFVHFGRCSPYSLVRIKSLSLLSLFYVLLWKLPYSIKLLFNLFFFFFFFLLVRKMSLSSVFRLMTSSLPIKLNGYIASEVSLIHSLHLISSWALSFHLHFHSVSKLPPIFPMPYIHSFVMAVSVFFIVKSLL